MGLPMEQAWEYEDPPLDTEQWMARMSFLLDPSDIFLINITESGYLSNFPRS